MNDDLISRSALKEELEKYYEDKITPSVRFAISILQNIIDNAPTVHGIVAFVERPKGEWIADTSHCYNDDEDTFECSVCKEPFTLICGTPKDNLYNFCPNCGADMRGEKE